MVMKKLDDGTIVSRVQRIPDVIPIKLNEQEKEILAKAMEVLEQTKPSTTIKQLSLYIGTKVLFQDLVGDILSIVFENKRKNKRLGYDVEFE